MAKKPKQDKHEAGETTQRVEKPATGDNTQPGTDPQKKGSNAPRARKHDYGIKEDAKVVRLVEVANVKRDIQNQFAFTEGDPTVAEFYAKGGDRHGLRVMSRRKLIKIQHLDASGNVVAEFPQAYVKPAPKTEETKPAEQPTEAPATS